MNPTNSPPDTTAVEPAKLEDRTPRTSNIMTTALMAIAQDPWKSMPSQSNAEFVR